MCITLPGLRSHHYILVLFIFLASLPVDMAVDFGGQVVLSAAIWGALFYVFAAMQPYERFTLWSCLTIATAGELFLSWLWGLYTYRLGNIPFFIPPGHVMLLILAIGMAPRVPRRLADAVLLGAGAYAIWAAAAGLDTLALPLLAFLVAVAINNPADRPLYACTFVLALALELYGTWLGNWTWVREVPILPFVTTNPPGLVSAFYAVLDALVACAAVPLARRFARSAHAHGEPARAMQPPSPRLRWTRA